MLTLILGVYTGTEKGFIKVLMSGYFSEKYADMKMRRNCPDLTQPNHFYNVLELLGRTTKTTVQTHVEASVVQWLCHSPCNPGVAGSIPGFSSPSDGTINRGPVSI